MKTVVFIVCPVEFDDVSVAGLLVQSVNVLGYNSIQIFPLFQFCKGNMRWIGSSGRKELLMRS